MRISILKALGSLLMSLIGTVVAADPEQQTAAVELPQAVADAVKAAYPAGVIMPERTDKDVDPDETTYEVTLMNHGKRFKVEVDSGGAIREIEGEVDPVDLPKAVTSALAERFPDGVTTSAEEHVDIVQKRETKVFKVVVVAGGKPLDVRIQPGGVIEDVDD